MTDAEDQTSAVAAPRPVKYNTKLVIGVILAAVSILVGFISGLLALILAVIAVILGHIGAREIKTSGEASPNLAVWTLVLSYITISIIAVVTIVGIIIGGSSAHNMAPGNPAACTWPTNPTEQQEQACFDSSGNL